VLALLVAPVEGAGSGGLTSVHVCGRRVDHVAIAITYLLLRVFGR
jgi:hypothetical protein